MPLFENERILRGSMHLHENERIIYSDAELPRLHYSLWERKKKISISVIMILLDSMIIPIILYFALWRVTDLSHSTVMTIISFTIGGTVVLETIQRTWRLWKEASTCRVTGAPRYFFDSYHWIMTICLLTVITLVVIGGFPTEPDVRLVALAAPAFLFTLACQLLFIDMLRLLHIRAPFRISSVPRGGIIRPSLYTVIEDVVAVNGGGGTAYRERLNDRYEASYQFRQMLHKYSFSWTIPAILVATATATVMYSVDENLAYVLGWCVPFLWASIWTAITITIVKRDLKDEEKFWEREKIRGVSFDPDI